MIADQPVRIVPGPSRPSGCRCAACTVGAALVLLSTGRAEMALRLLEPLATALRGMGDVSADLTVDRAELARLRAQVDGQRLAAELAGGTVAAERVAEILRVRPADVAGIAAGRVG